MISEEVVFPDIQSHHQLNELIVSVPSSLIVKLIQHNLSIRHLDDVECRSVFLRLDMRPSSGQSSSLGPFRWLVGPH